MREFFKQNKVMVTQIVLTIVVILIGMVLTKSKIVEELDIWVSVGLLVILAIVVLGTVCLAAAMIDHSKNLALHKILERYQTKAEALEGDWYYSMDRLQQYEQEFVGETIRVVSKLLEHERSDSGFFKIIKGNIKRGITYKYIIPSSDTMDNILPGVLGKFNGGQQPTIKRIKREHYSFPSDILVFGGNDGCGQCNTVFMELRIEKEKENRAWAKLAKMHGDTIVEEIDRVLALHSDSSS